MSAANLKAIAFSILAIVMAFISHAGRAATLATNVDLSNPSDLKPPLPLILPTFWETYGWQIGIGVFIAFILLGCLLYGILKPKRIIPDAPVVVARRKLGELRSRTEDGVLLMAVSGILKQYLNPTLGFMPGEKTTAEFCALLSRQSLIPEAMAEDIAAFLRRCDEWKFSPSPRSEKLNAVDAASQLINRIEVSANQSAEPNLASSKLI